MKEHGGSINGHDTKDFDYKIQGDKLSHFIPYYSFFIRIPIYHFIYDTF